MIRGGFMITRFKNAIKGESGMPTTEAVMLIAVALMLYLAFLLFKDQIAAFLEKLGNVVEGWQTAN